ncbi:hypothetical protein XELAEV_18036508mg [Xenopus laevis]|uniref:Secreted protein n=1 Tax=Xenopus laevis TaxID=8355 RepID=A0A974HDJ3_XENLA|nr:hypothetical protein XELAEV_18036508mg [Xenopus laevis]
MGRLAVFMMLYLIPALFVLLCAGCSGDQQDDEREMDQGESSGDCDSLQMGNRAEESTCANVQMIVSSVILGMGTIKLAVLGL